MTKEELLVSLKPLEWGDKDTWAIYADTKLGSYVYSIGGTYLDFLFTERGAHVPNEYVVTIGKYLSFEVAKQVAQEHYNYLVLSLFKLEE